MGTYFWTVVGSVAGVVAVAIGAVQMVRRREPATPKDARTSNGGRREDYADSAFPPFGHRSVELRGRDELRAVLTEKLIIRDGKAHVLCGLGGVGKTAVAIEIAAQARELGRQVWWITVKDSDSLLRTALGILASLKVPAEELHRSGPGAENPADLFWRHIENQQGWLLVFDQADDPETLALGENPVSDGRGWVRGSGSGVVLVTSRHSEAETWGSNVVIHQLQPLDDDDGATVLLDLAPDAGTRAEARQLSSMFAGLPLALHLAGRHLSSPESDQTTFAAYEEVLPRQLTTLMGGSDEPDAARMRALVTFTWELSLRALNSHGMPEARKMLRLLSCFALGVGVPRILLDLPTVKQILGKRAHPSQEVLQALRSVGLIDYEAVGNGHPVKVVRIHPLVASITRNQMSRFRRLIGPYGLSDNDMWHAPLVAVRLVNEAMADLRRRAGGQRSIIVGMSLDHTTSTLHIGPRGGSDSVNPRHTATLALLDDLADSSAARQLLSSHVYELLRYDNGELPDRDLANLIRSAAFCLLDLLDFGFSADVTEMMELIFSRLSRWGPNPAIAAANMNLKYHPPDIPYGREVSRLI